MSKYKNVGLCRVYYFPGDLYIPPDPREIKRIFKQLQVDIPLHALVLNAPWVVTKEREKLVSTYRRGVIQDFVLSYRDPEMFAPLPNNSDRDLSKQIAIYLNILNSEESGDKPYIGRILSHFDLPVIDAMKKLNVRGEFSNINLERRLTIVT